MTQAAKRLRQRGFRLLRNDGVLSLEPASETKLVEQLEKTIGATGGINVARRIFQQVTPHYEPSQKRYHLVRHTSPTGGGSPTTPFGYLLLLSVKHFAGTGPIRDTVQNWAELLRLATDYAAVLDVQGYTPSIWGSTDTVALLPYLQETALYDTLFCLPQIRGSDVEKIARGILWDYDFDKKHGSGWSLNDALAVIAVLLEKSLAQRGPVRFDARGIAATCPTVPKNIIQKVIDEALCHPHPGANQRFAKPTDAAQSLDPSERDAGVETDQYVIFLEIKKKPLTRRAQAGSDAHVLLDLANSLLAAQVQAGWHEVRSQKQGFIELSHAGTKTRLELKGRNVERIAVSLMQFGGFQDRVLLKQFLEATMNASFGVNDPAMQKAFAKFNALLGELREQSRYCIPAKPNWIGRSFIAGS